MARIAQITFHNAQNCGAALQTFALQSVLAKMGHNVFQPNCNHVGDFLGHYNYPPPAKAGIAGRLKHYLWVAAIGTLSFVIGDLISHRFKVFAKKWMRVLDISCSDIPTVADIAVFGSDQIWNARVTCEDADYFLGKTLSGKLPLMAYAASPGDSIGAQQISSGFFSSFRFVSFRDNAPVGGDVVADPTLLLSATDYEPLSFPRRITKGLYVFVYNVNGDPDFSQWARDIAGTLACRCVVVNMGQRSLWRYPVGEWPATSPDRFLSYVKNCSCVITNSFHGVAFSLIMHKPFVAYGPRQPGRRIYSLLERLRETGRLYENFDDVESAAMTLRHGVTDEAYALLDDFRAGSLRWLENALDACLHA